MVKTKTVFVCQQCGADTIKWSGKCPSCGEWNSLIETVVPDSHKGSIRERERIVPQKLSEIKTPFQSRMKTGIGELDRVLGGGIVSGSLVLVAGEPGIGKSTLLLQLASFLSDKNSFDKKNKDKDFNILYVSGEESPQQIKIRAERLGVKKRDNLLFLPQTDVDQVVEAIRDAGVRGSGLVIIDSIQTLTTEDLSSSAGSVGQVRESTLRLLKIAKSTGLPIFLVGHVTKEGAVAGPKVLEHMVDTVLYLEGEKLGTFRLLRTNKNRFGATDEVGVFEMMDKGMIEVSNPSRLFLTKRQKRVPGSVVVATMEGTRPMLVEIQALVVPTQLALPRRFASGIDFNRLQLITAVLSKRLGLPLGSFDIFVNVAGGLRIEEPAADLGVALAIYTSFKNLFIDPKTVVFGELGLLGETREVAYVKQRQKEAKRLGFTEIITPEKYSSINQVVKILK